MKVVINYNDDSNEYILYSSDLDVAFTSNEMFKVLVMFNSYITEKYGEKFNVLKSDSIEYIMDSGSMKQMILSNVNLIKKLSKLPTEFQISSEKFGSSSCNNSQFMKRSTKSTDEFNKMMKNRKSFKTNKFK